MSRAIIFTVGAQPNQIVFSLQNLKPEYIGLLATDTLKSRKVIEELNSVYPLRPIKHKILFTMDSPAEIGRLVKNFQEILEWLTEQEKIVQDEIVVDPTGGRKWMSAGVTMYASFLGLPMKYVDVAYDDNGRPDPSTMEIKDIANAYEQVGFLKEREGDRLFNEYNFKVAKMTYEFLEGKLSDPRLIGIKKIISQGYLEWMQFNFEKAFMFLKEALEKTKQYRLLEKYIDTLKKQIEILEILKRNDENRENYFSLLREDEFPKKMFCFFMMQSERYAEFGNYDLSVILLYRIIEFIAQVQLARLGVDVEKVTLEIRNRYNEKFKQITKMVFNASSEIPDKLALMQSWILLYCMGDRLVKNENARFLKELSGKLQIRNLLWIEHRNTSVDKIRYEKFKNFVFIWMQKWDATLIKDFKDYEFIKFM